MKHLIRTTAFGVVAAAFAASAAPALAKPPHCPPGHAKKGWCGPGWKADGYDQWRDRGGEQRAYEQGYKDGQRDAIRYDGRYYDDYRVIRDYDRYGLQAPPSGHYYAEVDGDVMMVELATQLVTQLMSNGRY
ncbi:RcnB family protein [Henriciella aquimarina]|uniref:RcnB family protein n=1 Tax=Henriciella aquimarina TaxID=545261 RepID=UPI001301E58A|nr:RcnB family protein [Henriciella aquimarina]